MTFCPAAALQAGSGSAGMEQGLLCVNHSVNNLITAARTAVPSCKSKTVQVSEKDNFGFFFVGCSNFQKFRRELFAPLR